MIGDPRSWGTGRTPAIEVMALLQSNSKFNAKGFAARSHRSVVVPDIRGIYRDAGGLVAEDYELSLASVESSWARSESSRNTTEAQYWQGFTDCAKARDVKYLLVEHAHALCTTRKDETPADHVQNLMSVLETVGAMGVLTFVPSGHKLWADRPEVSSRIFKIFIKPYDLKCKKEVAEYARLLIALASAYSFDDQTTLKELCIELAIATGTSIRPMQELLKRALACALSDGRERISREDLTSSLPSENEIAAVWRDVALIDLYSTSPSLKAVRNVHLGYVKNTLVDKA